MKTRAALVVLLVAAAIALEAAFLHAVVATPLASAVGNLSRRPTATFEESITVVATPPQAEPRPAS